MTGFGEGTADFVNVLAVAGLELEAYGASVYVGT